MGGGISLIGLSSLSTISCSNSNSYIIDKELKNSYVDWYNSLSNDKWNKTNGEFDNYFCYSEQQAISLYANYRGWFWNESLHQKKEPLNQKIKIYLLSSKKLEVRGSDYKYIVNALDRAIVPKDMIVWHGVEYQEDEFYDQLKNYISWNNGKIDFTKCIGKTIESYGFFSTTLQKNKALEYCDGAVFNNEGSWEEINEWHLPLIEKAIFKINIKQGYKGAAYLADFDFAGSKNIDDQLLINKNCRFLIKDVWKEKDVNVFEVDLIQ